MKHFEIIHHPKNVSPHVVCYAVNWRKVRAAIREQKKERTGEKMTVKRVHPYARWVLNAYTYAMLRHFDRDEIRARNGHQFKP